MKYNYLIFTNPETLRYFIAEKLSLQVSLEDIDRLVVISDSFMEVGTFNLGSQEIPVVVKKMWHDDTHFLTLCKGEIIGDQLFEDYSMDYNNSDFLVLH